MTQTQAIKPLMTRTEFAALVDLSPTTVSKMIASNEIETVGSRIPAREYYKLFACKSPVDTPTGGDAA